MRWIQVGLNSPVHLRIVTERGGNFYAFQHLNTGQTQYVGASLGGTYIGDKLTDLLYFGGDSPAPHDVTVIYDNIEIARCFNLSNASQSWTVQYTDKYGNIATADGGPGDSFDICAKENSIQVVLGDVQGGYICRNV
jgi:hypothetical protein